MAQRLKHLPAVQETRFNPWVGKIPWRRKWQPTPIFLPGESHGWRSLVGYISPWGCKESDVTSLYFLSTVIRPDLWASLVAQTVQNLPAVQETLVQSLGQEDPLENGMATQYSCLGNPMDRGVQEVAKSWDRAEWLTLQLFNQLSFFSSYLPNFLHQFTFYSNLFYLFSLGLAYLFLLLLDHLPATYVYAGTMFHPCLLTRRIL